MPCSAIADFSGWPKRQLRLCSLIKVRILRFMVSMYTCPHNQGAQYAPHDDSSGVFHRSLELMDFPRRRIEKSSNASRQLPINAVRQTSNIGQDGRAVIRHRPPGTSRLDCSPHLRSRAVDLRRLLQNRKSQLRNWGSQIAYTSA